MKHTDEFNVIFGFMRNKSVFEFASEGILDGIIEKFISDYGRSE